MSSFASPPSPFLASSPPAAAAPAPVYFDGPSPVYFDGPFPFDDSHSSSSFPLVIFIVITCVIVFLFFCAGVNKLIPEESEEKNKTTSKNDDSWFIPLNIVQFFEDMERENPIRFTAQQLKIATDNFTIKLGSGGFGSVYKGLINNSKPVAVKVLNGTSNQQIEEQFMAEVSTMGRTHHFNLVRLYGFCFESDLIALVYEYMVNGSLDNYLYKANNEAAIMLGFEKLHEIAVGTARGLAYLHEDCAQRIIHYDIKPGNILLDLNFCAKVADFGLAKLCNRDNTHITLAGGRGTPGYAAPEVWMRFQITHKCDVYSFGMLLFEIIGRRRDTATNIHDDIREWFPIWAWDKYENNRLKDLMTECVVEVKDHEVVERMLKVAFCCVQYKPECRPVMSIVVKMLEGLLDVHESLNPFTHLISGANEPLASSTYSSSFESVTRSDVVMGTPRMMRYEITMASV